MRTVSAVPIDAERYAPFGSIVTSRGAGRARSANHGAAQAWDALATLVNARDGAQVTASLFRCTPPPGPSLEVRWLERHAHATQMFVPMNASRYLVVVALGGETPDLDSLVAFVVGPTDAITYAPGTWHHPMVALDQETDFVNVVASDGTPGDCDERAFAPPTVRVTLPPAVGAS